MLLTLDLGAMLAISALLSAIATLLLLTTWRAAGRPAYLAAWAGFCGLGTLAFTLHALRDALPGGILVLLATPAYLLGWTLFWIGCRRLAGAAVPRWLPLLPVALWYLACTLPAFRAELEARATLAAGLVGLLSLAGAVDALRLRGSAGLRRAALPLGLLNLVFGTVLLGRILAHLAGQAVPFGGQVFLFGAVTSVAIGFAGLALASIRTAESDAARIAGAAQREAAALEAGRAEIAVVHAALPAVLFHSDLAADGTSRLIYRGGDVVAVTGWPAAHLADPVAMERVTVGGLAIFVAFEERVLRDGFARTDWQLRDPDGRLRWMRSTARRLTRRADGGGDLVGHVLDVSAEYAAAAAAEAGRVREAVALQAGRAEVERLLAGLPAVIFLRNVQPDGTSRLLYRSGDIEGVTGWPQEALAAQETWRHLSGPDAPDFPAAYRAVLETGDATTEWRMRRPDGSLQWMRTYVSRLSLRPDGSGEVTGYMLNIDRERSAEAELETVLRAAPLAVYRGRVTAAGGFTRTHLSRGIERVTGWPWEVVSPSGGLRRIAEPAGLEVEPEQVRAMLAQGIHIRDLRMRRPDDRWIWTRHTVVPLAPDGAGGAEVVGFIVDVTAEREAMARELEVRAELDRTLAAAPVAVLRGRISPTGRLSRTFLSRGIEQVTGWPWETVNTRGGLSRIIEPASRAALPDRLRQLLRDGTIRYDHRLRRADGAWADVRSTLSVLDRLADGSVEVVGFLADVTAERAAQAQAAAAGRLAALGEMGTGLAHELKQPLATISLAAENALRSVRRGQPEAAVPRLERIVAQAQRAAGIIENLRRFARGSDPGAPPVAVPSGQAVESALALVGGPLREAGIEIDLALGDPPPAVLGQLVSLEQVLVNLLVNAADALRGLPPGAPRRIRVAAEATAGAMVRLTIGDTGGGIPAAVLPRLFEPFVSTKDADQGTGLGLSICHGLVKAMGGTIEARNAAEGAVFTILLPQATEAVSPAA